MEGNMGASVAAVVGVGPGIGLAVARRFAMAGMDIALVARNSDRLDQFQESLAPYGRAVRSYACDVSEQYELVKVFQDLRESLGMPEVLVYNASVLKEAPPSRLSPEGFIREFRTNCMGALVCAEEVIPEMRRRQQGTIIFTGGGLALKPRFPLASLSIGKGAIRTLALMLADELEPEGIHVATVTVDGFVQPGTALDPDRIAEEYWKLHKEPKGRWTREVLMQ
jgi:NAD(P)-dependent dehydrogenase (short-subunit alcohol dehydrogenase family)